MLAIATLLIVVSFSLVITRVASVALALTGMSPDAARFQARSALSGTGFTSTESEQIIGHPARRQVVMTLMLLGNAGLVTTVATLSVSFTSVEDAGGLAVRIAVLVVGLAVLLVVARSMVVARVMTRIIERLLRRYSGLDVRDYAGLLHVGMDFSVDRLGVDEGEWLAGQTLAAARLSDEGAVVLGIERDDGTFLGAPTGETVVESGDTLLIYGTGTCLGELADRPAGRAGELAHDRNVAANHARILEEQAIDESRRQ